MQITKKYSLVRIALIVVELFQENNQFWRVFGSWLVFYSIRECTRELAPTFVLVNIQTKTTSDFNAMNLLRGKQASIWNLSKHPNQKQRAISRRWIYCGESNRNIQTKNKKRFQRDEFIEGKQTPITRNIQKSKTTSEFNARQSFPRLKLEWIEWMNNQTTYTLCNVRRTRRWGASTPT